MNAVHMNVYWRNKNRHSNTDLVILQNFRFNLNCMQFTRFDIFLCVVGINWFQTQYSFMCPCVPNLLHCCFVLHTSSHRWSMYRNEIKCGNHSFSLSKCIVRCACICVCLSECVAYAHIECCHRIVSCARETVRICNAVGCVFRWQNIFILSHVTTTIHHRVGWMCLRQSDNHIHMLRTIYFSSLVAAKLHCCRT